MSNDEFIVMRRVGRGDASMPVVHNAESSAAESAMVVALEALDRQNIAEMRRDPEVVAVAPPMPLRLIRPVPRADGEEPAASDPAAREPAAVTWGVAATSADRSPRTGAGVTVAVLDTGIDRSHEAFAGIDIVERDFTGDGDGDEDGHGTHCAGTIFGRRPAESGPRIGVATGVTRALIGKVIGSQGGGTDAIFRAITWAIDEGAHIVSMSLGIDFPGFVARMIERGTPADLATSQALQAYRENVRLFDSLSAFVEAQGGFRPQGGTVLIAASGNESKRHVSARYELAVAPPANADGILSVGAVGRGPAGRAGLALADFSNTGPRVVGPGVDVVSARTGGGYVAFSGTSMATPHVAGIAALWAEAQIAASGRLRARDLLRDIESHAVTDPLDESIDPYAVGAGLVQAPQT